MGDLRNCPECGKVFVKISKNLCPDCIEKDEKAFEEVRAYLKDYPGASVEEICGATGVEEKKVLKWIREGQIEVCFREGGRVLTCKGCGVPVTSGNFCARCAKDLSSQIETATRPGHKRESADSGDAQKRKGMFTADRAREE